MSGLCLLCNQFLIVQLLTTLNITSVHIATLHKAKLTVRSSIDDIHVVLFRRIICKMYPGKLIKFHAELF